MAITLSPPSGSSLPAATEISVTISGVDSGTHTYWTSSDPTVRLFVPDSDYIPVGNAGTATNTMLATNRAGASRSTIAVSDGTTELARADYRFDYFNLSGLSADRLWANSTFGLHVDPLSGDELVAFVTTLQGSTGAGISRGTVGFTTEHDSLQFFDGSTAPPTRLTPDSQGRYLVTSNEQGLIEILIGATSAGIYSITLGPTSQNEGLPVTFVFIDLFISGVLQPTIVGAEGELSLDNYPGNNITVAIQNDILNFTNFTENSLVQVVRVPLDGQERPDLQPIGRVQTVRDMLVGVPYSKTDFPDGTYYIYHMVYDDGSGQIAQSVMTPITVTGSSAVGPQAGGPLPKPIVAANVVNTVSIVPYLGVGVPQNDEIQAGDVVTLEWFADAWVPGTATKKTGHQPYTKTVTRPGALEFQIPPADLMNFGAAPGGSPRGNIQFQYSVVRAHSGERVESQITSKWINTAPITQ